MANTYVLIASATNFSDSTFSFSNIPQTYTDLLIKLSLKYNSSNSFTQNVYPTVNGVSSGYSSTTFYNAGSTPGAVSRTGEWNFSTEIYTNGNAVTANSFGLTEFYIPNYTSSNKKCILADVVTETNATTNSTHLGATAVLWDNTSAITSFQILASLTGSCYLYGIKNS